MYVLPTLKCPCKQVHCTYIPYGGKLWQIYSIDTLPQENLANLCNSLSKNISENINIIFCKNVYTEY